MSGGVKFEGKIFMGKTPSEVAKLRGMPADPSIPLAELRNVRMMRKDMKFLAKAGYARKALLLLDEDPLIPGSEPPAFASTPDSARYSSHLQVMNRNVLEVFGTYMPNRKAIIHRGVVMRMPYIVRYSAVHKTPADARAIFNMKRTNKEMNANKVAFSLPGAARLKQSFEKCHSKRQN